MEINQTIEDYLRSIYRVEIRDGKASNAALARELNISSAAITDMVRRLADGGLLEYAPYQGATLTRSGHEVAIDVTRRHRLWEVFLIRHLGYEWDQVHELADQLEHIRSDSLIDRLDAFLGHPAYDPHGDPIPSKDGVVAKRALVKLLAMKPGERGIVARVSDEYPELLRYASSLGLAINSRVCVVERIEFDGSIRILTDSGAGAVVSEKLADSVFVELDGERQQ